MTDTNKPGGYGHDKQGAAGGDNKGDGKPAVSHKGPVDSVDGEAKGAPAIAFFLDGREVLARAGETI